MVELQALVQEGRTYIAKEVTKHKNLLDGNMKILEKRLAEVGTSISLPSFSSYPPTYLPSTTLPYSTHLLCVAIPLFMSNPNNRILLIFSLSLAFAYPSSILVPSRPLSLVFHLSLPLVSTGDDNSTCTLRRSITQYARGIRGYLSVVVCPRENRFGRSGGGAGVVCVSGFRQWSFTTHHH